MASQDYLGGDTLVVLRWYLWGKPRFVLQRNSLVPSIVRSSIVGHLKCQRIQHPITITPNDINSLALHGSPIDQKRPPWVFYKVGFKRPLKGLSLLLLLDLFRESPRFYIWSTYHGTRERHHYLRPQQFEPNVY
jgi:hypothetical protein